MLDIDHGTYPFVLLLEPDAGGLTGSGVGPDPHRLRGRRRQGVRPASASPFPTELDDGSAGPAHQGGELGLTKRRAPARTIPVYVAYRVDGVVTEEMPLDQAGFEAAVPVYEELPAGAKTSRCGCFDELPQAAQDYIKRLEGCRAAASSPSAGR